MWLYFLHQFSVPSWILLTRTQLFETKNGCKKFIFNSTSKFLTSP